jgi:uncharacterized membrane protein YdcZ (DUF606 family)
VVTGQVLPVLRIDRFGLMRSLRFPLVSPQALGATLMLAGVCLALRR